MYPRRVNYSKSHFPNYCSKICREGALSTPLIDCCKTSYLREYLQMDSHWSLPDPPVSSPCAVSDTVQHHFKINREACVIDRYITVLLITISLIILDVIQINICACYFPVCSTLVSTLLMRTVVYWRPSFFQSLQYQYRAGDNT